MVNADFLAEISGKVRILPLGVSANVLGCCDNEGMDVTGTGAQAGRGLFITFEGGDGSGKTTQIQSVREWFESRGIAVVVTREPGGTELGTTLRHLVQMGPEDVDPRTEALLYAADRAYHVSTLIRPALEAGTVVLCDRYIDSSLAYQGAARNLGVDEIRSLSQWATGDLHPDVTLLLDLPPEVAARRRPGRPGAPDRMERESMDFHERVRHQYLRLADAEPDRIAVIDAVGTAQEVFREIRGVLEERCGDFLKAAEGSVHAEAGNEGTAGTKRKGRAKNTPARAAAASSAPADAQVPLWESTEDGVLL